MSPKWKRQPDQRPAQILDAALDVFADKGFRGATMQDVAAAAGITKGTIYLYFPGKEALFVAAVRAQFRQAYDLLPKIAFDKGQDPESLTKQVGRQFLEVLMTPQVTRAIPLVIAELNHLPALKKLYKEEILPKANIQLAGLLELGMQLGLVRRLDPVIAARCLFGMFFIFVMTQEVFEAKNVTPMDVDEILDTIVTVYFRGILNQGQYK